MNKTRVLTKVRIEAFEKFFLKRKKNAGIGNQHFFPFPTFFFYCKIVYIYMANKECMVGLQGHMECFIVC